MHHAECNTPTFGRKSRPSSIVVDKMMSADTKVYDSVGLSDSREDNATTVTLLSTTL